MPGLDQSKLFNGLTPEALTCLQKEVVERVYQVGETVFHEGDPGDGLYVIGDGQVQISALVAANERGVLAMVGPGDFFGEMAVIDQEPRSASAVAEKQTKVFFIPRGALLNLIERSPRLASNLFREFSLKMREFNRQYIREVLQAERLAVVGRFARTIVHDFKNPLNIIGLAADFMEMDTASPEVRRTSSARIRRQVDRLTNMTNELLEFTRGPHTQVVLAATQYRNYLEKLLEDFRPELADKRIEIVVEGEVPDVAVLADHKRLVHVFSNLFHNAADTMTDGGKITIRCIIEGKNLRTEVEDEGPGLAPEIAPRLFEAFATFGKSKGTGLGLSICKRIIEDHKGSIKAWNGPRGGAIFAFSIPLTESR